MLVTGEMFLIRLSRDLEQHAWDERHDQALVTEQVGWDVVSGNAGVRSEDVQDPTARTGIPEGQCQPTMLHREVNAPERP